MLISVHVPKCAGMSFGRMLETQFGSRLWRNYGAVFTRDQVGPTSVPAGTECIHGHFLADAFDGLFPEAELVAWVRHPVERVVSNYEFFRRHPDMRDDCCRLLHERNLTLTEFAELDWMRNEATRYLAQKPLAAFAAVGIQERFEESAAWFARRFRWTLPGRLPRENVNPARAQPHYDIPRRTYDYLLALNAADLMFYEQANCRLDVVLERVPATAA